MRLVALTTSFPLDEGSSAGLFVKRLYEHLPEPWRVEVLCPADTRSARREAPSSRVQVCPIRYAPRRWQVLAQCSGGIAAGLREAPWKAILVPGLLVSLWCRSLRASRSADLLHANWAVCGAIAAAACALTSRPLVTTLRGDDVTRADCYVIDRWLLKAAVRGSAAVICVSEAMAVRLRDLFPDRANDIYVCLNGVDPEFLAVERLPPEPGCLRIAAVGSLIYRKGHDLLIEAVARMTNRGGVSLKIAGSGPARSALITLADRLGVLEDVTFEGDVTPTNVPQFLGQADVFVLSSRSEGRPNVVVEALAAGLPVVSSDLPGTEGLVITGVNGWRVGVEDVAGLAAALDEAFVDAVGRERLGAAAREGIGRGGNDWYATGECYNTVFQKTLTAQFDRGSRDGRAQRLDSALSQDRDRRASLRRLSGRSR